MFIFRNRRNAGQCFLEIVVSPFAFILYCQSHPICRLKNHVNGTLIDSRWSWLDVTVQMAWWFLCTLTRKHATMFMLVHNNMMMIEMYTWHWDKFQRLLHHVSYFLYASVVQYLCSVVILAALSVFGNSTTTTLWKIPQGKTTSDETFKPIKFDWTYNLAVHSFHRKL